MGGVKGKSDGCGTGMILVHRVMKREKMMDESYAFVGIVLEYSIALYG